MKNLGILFFFLLVLASCSEDDPTATINVNPPNTVTNAVDGDVRGNGGSASRTFTWPNSRPTADYNMDMTVANGGSFQMIIKDAAGTVVLDYTLIKGQTPDSKSGVTASGVTGNWTIQINLKNFNGSGSYDLSQGT